MNATFQPGAIVTSYGAPNGSTAQIVVNTYASKMASTNCGIPCSTDPETVSRSPSRVERFTAASTPAETPMAKLTTIPDSTRMTVHGAADATICATGTPS